MIGIIHLIPNYELRLTSGALILCCFSDRRRLTPWWKKLTACWKERRHANDWSDHVQQVSSLGCCLSGIRMQKAAIFPLPSQVWKTDGYTHRGWEGISNLSESSHLTQAEVENLGGIKLWRKQSKLKLQLGQNTNNCQHMQITDPWILRTKVTAFLTHTRVWILM